MLWLYNLSFPQGARVIIGDLQVSDGEKVAREVGDNATFVPMDVSTNNTHNTHCLKRITPQDLVSGLINTTVVPML